MKRVAPIKRMRWQLGLSQEEFANRFEIPIGTLRDWEQGRSSPDRPARAYLKVISSDPGFVSRALHADEATSVSASRLAAKALSNQDSLGRSAKGLAASALSQGAGAQRGRKKKNS
ncbi:helix-turn-helix domain-containing protein [Hyphomicrobium sp. xq]|uniref:Helix-turn-helix domain-containing protein n=2 Tax=Hyphomicrobium album TaxID=2665159 RepID=A0A6I3KKL6_9HYPH|nr:helix-turn-helix domain-containing protein [Hyphomicrobium album]